MPPRSRAVIWIVLGIGLAAIAVLGFVLRPGHRPTAPVATSPPPAVAEYVGTAACAHCHGPEAAAWRGSDHDLAMQEATAENVLGDFDDATFTYAGTTTTFSRRDGVFL